MNKLQRSDRSRRWVVFASAIALLVAGLFVWSKFRHERPEPSEGLPEQGQAMEMPPSWNGSRSPLQNDDPLQAGNSSTNRPPLRNRADKLKVAVNGMNVPIHFWGLVVDEDNVPLPGVKVQTEVRTWGMDPIGIGSGSFSKQEALTGADGRFAIDGGRGDDLQIQSLQKAGYEPEPKVCRGFTYTGSAPFIPDQNSPVVLRMWRTNLHVRLLTGSYRWSLVPDGRVYTVDLRRGTCLESNALEGDFRLSMKRAPDAATARRFDWSLLVHGIGGGFMEEADPTSAMFEAPAGGYTNEISVSQSTANPRWSSGTRKRRFYLQSRNGQSFGRIEFQAHALYLQDGQGRFNITYAINETGGRLLRGAAR